MAKQDERTKLVVDVYRQLTTGTLASIAANTTVIETALGLNERLAVGVPIMGKGEIKADAQMEAQRLLKLLFCLLDRGTGSSNDALLFDGMSHEQLVRTFVEYLNQHRHYIGYCHIEQSHALNDRGVDIILQAQRGKIGFQIKSHFDVKQEDFAANVKRQYTESLAHGLDHYFILICCPLRKEGKVDLQQKVSHLLNELSSLKTEYHTVYGPLNTARYFMGLPTLSRDELLLRRAVDSEPLHEYEKGYEHLPELDDEEIQKAQAHFESFGEDWWDIPEGPELFDRLNDVLKRKAAQQFATCFLPTLPAEVKQRRAELISTARALLAACRECRSWEEQRIQIAAVARQRGRGYDPLHVPPESAPHRTEFEAIHGRSQRVGCRDVEERP